MHKKGVEILVAAQFRGGRFTHINIEVSRKACNQEVFQPGRSIFRQPAGRPRQQVLGQYQPLLNYNLDEIPAGAYLAICLEGEHGIEGAYAAIRVDGLPVGAPDRSPSYPVNPFEYPVMKAKSHYTYYVPLTADMLGKEIDVVVLGMKGGIAEFKPEVWLTTYPAPYVKKELILNR